jgi:hypothetical protein
MTHHPAKAKSNRKQVLHEVDIPTEPASFSGCRSPFYVGELWNVNERMGVELPWQLFVPKIA